MPPSAEPFPSREKIRTLVLRDATRGLRRDLERPEGPSATPEAVTLIRENVTRWLDDRAKLA